MTHHQPFFEKNNKSLAGEREVKITQSPSLFIFPSLAQKKTQSFPVLLHIKLILFFFSFSF
jgi:hypothetical protein